MTRAPSDPAVTWGADGAFARAFSAEPLPFGQNAEHAAQVGMTKREHMATVIFAALLEGRGDISDSYAPMLAKKAVIRADALIAALNAPVDLRSAAEAIGYDDDRR